MCLGYLVDVSFYLTYPDISTNVTVSLCIIRTNIERDTEKSTVTIVLGIGEQINLIGLPRWYNHVRLIDDTKVTLSSRFVLFFLPWDYLSENCLLIYNWILISRTMTDWIGRPVFVVKWNCDFFFEHKLNFNFKLHTKLFTL